MSVDIKESLLASFTARSFLRLSPEKLTGLYEQCIQFSSSSVKFDRLNKLDRNNILLLQFQLCILTCHDIEAKSTLERMADLVYDNDLINGQSEWLIYWRSIYLQCQLELEKNNKIDSTTIDLQPVYEYLDKASESLIKTVNRRLGSSITSAGDASKLRHTGDLYVLQKRKVSLLCGSKNKKRYIEGLLRLIDMRPLDYGNWCELAQVYYDNGQLEECHYCLLEVLVGVPMAYNIWAKMGEISLLLDKLSSKNGQEYLKNAVRYFSRSVEICDNYSRGWCGLYVALQRLKNSDEMVYTKLKGITQIRLKELINGQEVNPKEIDNIKLILGKC